MVNNLNIKINFERVFVALCAFLAIFLQGCATTASAPQFTHSPVPQERIFRIPPVSSGGLKATVHVMRDYQFKDSAMTTMLTINGEDAAAIKSGEKITFQVEVDEYILGLKYLGNDPVLGAFTLGLARPQRFIESATKFEEGKTYYFRIVDNANWEWELQRSSR